MIGVMEAALAIVLTATIDVAAGADVAAALASARPGDVVRLAAGEHRASLGRLSGATVEGAGAGATFVLAPQGTDGAITVGDVTLSGLSIVTGPERCALKVLGGTARVDDVALSGGACGAFVDGGRLTGRRVHAAGGYGLLVRAGEVSLDEGAARGRSAGVAVVGGTIALRRWQIVGPSREAGVTVAGGAATLDAVVIRAPGPSGISVSAGGRVEGRSVTVAGASELQGFLGNCVEVRRATLRLEASTLVRCAGAAVEASGGTLALTGVDATGGEAGCIVVLNGGSAELSGNVCAGRGPGLVAAGGARVRAEVNRWWTDPVMSVECGTGARVELGRGEASKQPCAGR